MIALRDTSLQGRTVLVTGANGGLGLAASTAFAARGARVLLACRNPRKGEDALSQVRQHGEAELVALDLADLDSVREAAAGVRARTGDSLDVLVNNAGVLRPRPRRLPDGAEAHFVVNHLGHAALTWLLLPALRGADAGRVVVVGSLSSRHSLVDPTDPDFHRRRLIPYLGYGASKSANLLFAEELGRRLQETGDSVTVVAAHPGVTHTSIGSHGDAGGLRNRVLDRVFSVIGSTPGEGAAPIVEAAVRPEIRTGAYLGPQGLFEVYGGGAKAARPHRGAGRRDVAQALWDLTAARTGVKPDPGTAAYR